MALEEVKSASNYGETVELNEKGQSVSGNLIETFNGTRKKDGSAFTKYTLLTEGGNKIAIFGSAELNAKMAQVSNGDFVVVTYGGMSKTSRGNRKHTYTVQRDASRSLAHASAS